MAFSREGAAKEYVQHQLAAAGARVWDLLRKPGAHMYICGDAKSMAKDVHRAVIEVVAKHGGMTSAKAEAWVKDFTDGGRLQRDVW